ncbi:MAG: hypothetical protein KatS3mg039_0110 [Candidatus Kapaibacterium sp.]|nr:MAG: hypothetical protein KatS3mg039_0110 [Candidatus Kapabacteria bacterium]
MVVCHVAGTAQRGQDGVTRVLYEYLERHRTAQLDAVVLAAVTDERESQRFPMVEMPSIRLPIYRDYKLFVGGTVQIERAIAHLGYTPNLFHLHTPCPLGRVALRWAREHGIPAIATYHTHFPSYLRHHRLGVLRPLIEKSLVEFYRRCDCVLVPSQILRDELQQWGIPARYLPHGTDTALFHPRWASHRWRQRLGIGEQQCVLLYVGRLVWEKNLRILVDVWNRLDRRQFAMVIVGVGPIESTLRRLMPGAQFLGYQAGVELAQSYASSDVFVFPSDTETFGNVTLEALASGLPCVVADSPGSSELVRHAATGFRIAPHDGAGFAGAIEALAGLSPDRRLLWRWRARLDAERYQWHSVCAELFSIYREVATPRAAGLMPDGLLHTASPSSP